MTELPLVKEMTESDKPKPKLILANPLIEQFIAAGLISKDCKEFVLHGKLGSPLMLHEHKFVRDVVLDLGSLIEEAPDEDSALAR